MFPFDGRKTVSSALPSASKSATVIVVPVPEAEALVGRYRLRHTTSGGKGMPAHITVVAPFVDSDLLAAGAIQEVRDLLSEFGAFGFSLARAAYFALDERRALYLAPTPSEPFVRMAETILGQFPYPALATKEAT